MSAEPVAGRRLVLVRHGQTAWNAERRFQGHADVELDAVGHAQAAGAGRSAAVYRPSVLWTSDLARASQTATYVEKETGLSALIDPRLREFDVGERTGLTYPDFLRRAHALDHGETPADLVARIMPAYDELLADLRPGETAAVVSHGGCLRWAVAALLGWPAGLAESLRTMDNCGLAVLTEADPGSWRLSAWNLAPDFVPADTAG